MQHHQNYSLTSTCAWDRTKQKRENSQTDRLWYLRNFSKVMHVPLRYKWAYHAHIHSRCCMLYLVPDKIAPHCKQGDACNYFTCAVPFIRLALMLHEGSIRTWQTRFSEDSRAVVRKNRCGHVATYTNANANTCTRTRVLTRTHVHGCVWVQLLSCALHHFICVYIIISLRIHMRVCVCLYKYMSKSICMHRDR